MTMTREAKRDAEKYTKGVEVLAFASPKLRKMCRDTGRGHYNMTAAEYAREYLGRRTTNIETAYHRMKEQAGWTYSEDTGRYRGPRVVTRRGAPARGQYQLAG